MTLTLPRHKWDACGAFMASTEGAIEHLAQRSPRLVARLAGLFELLEGLGASGQVLILPMLIVSGDADRSCNALHARKMTARLQAASVSPYPIFLDYSKHRGHSPVLPLSERIEALTDRMAFLCDQLQLPV